MDSVNADLKPLFRLVSAYAKQCDRAKYTLLFAFDYRCADILRSSSEILIAQMKLTWWRDILTMAPEDRPSGEPLVALVNQQEQQGVNLSSLQTLLAGWEMALDEFPWDDPQIENYAQNRGIGFFKAAVEDIDENQAELAKAWACWDFARHCADADMRSVLLSAAEQSYHAAGRIHFDRSGRPLSILCKLMARDVEKGRLEPDLYRPANALRIMWHGMTGL